MCMHVHACPCTCKHACMPHPAGARLSDLQRSGAVILLHQAREGEIRQRHVLRGTAADAGQDLA